jgi:hypothetical protein
MHASLGAWQTVKLSQSSINGYQTDLAERVRLNQQSSPAELKPHYDFIVCGLAFPVRQCTSAGGES